MRRLINTLTIIGIALAVFAIAYLLFGHATDMFIDNSTSKMALQLMAMTGALVALVFGFIGRFMDRRAPLPVSRVSNLGIFLGFIGGLIVLALPYL
ncbi:hypothetical protein [Litorimonas sp.]|jgi:sugar phosphate permease|uniref:hypothetical protein n=1 Tax=Litorimonas sp. TaxID=1892381 RepID=UPI003A845948